MGIEERVRDHYSGADLEGVVLDTLRRTGVDVDHMQVKDLSGLDQLHAGGDDATRHVLDALDLAPGTTLLDVGSGVGGPARLAAARHDCRVTGIDLSPDFVELARRLTARVGLTEQVTFDVGSATDLPHGDGTFARAMLNHVGMNIPDKAGMFAEVRRVLAPGGLFAVYEQMRLADGELTYPLPWAEDEESSFVEARERYGELLHAAGFSVDRDEDRSSSMGPPRPGALTPGDLFGPGFAERIGNNISATLGGIVGPVLMVARAA